MVFFIIIFSKFRFFSSLDTLLNNPLLAPLNSNVSPSFSDIVTVLSIPINLPISKFTGISKFKIFLMSDKFKSAEIL